MCRQGTVIAQAKAGKREQGRARQINEGQARQDKTVQGRQAGNGRHVGKQGKATRLADRTIRAGRTRQDRQGRKAGRTSHAGR